MALKRILKMIKQNSLYCFAGIILLLCLGGEPEIVFNHFKIFKDPLLNIGIDDEYFRYREKNVVNLLNILEQIKGKENIKLYDTLIIADVTVNYIANLNSYWIMNRDTSYSIELWDQKEVGEVKKYPNRWPCYYSTLINKLLSGNTAAIYDIISRGDETGHIILRYYRVIRKTSGTYIDIFLIEDSEEFWCDG